MIAEEIAPKIITLLGPPGAGKGTISRYCIQELGWEHLSTGNLCRKHISEQTEIGKSIDFAMKSGKLIPNVLIVQMVWDWLQNYMKSVRGIILDGFPRTTEQAEIFNRYLQSLTSPQALCVVRFTIIEDILIERLGRRFVCSNKECQVAYSISATSQQPQKAGFCDNCSCSLERRHDDSDIATIKERLRIYYEHEQTLMDFYQSMGIPLHTIKGDNHPEIVFEEFRRIVGTPQ